MAQTLRLLPLLFPNTTLGSLLEALTVLPAQTFLFLTLRPSRCAVFSYFKQPPSNGACEMPLAFSPPESTNHFPPTRSFSPPQPPFSRYRSSWSCFAFFIPFLKVDSFSALFQVPSFPRNFRPSLSPRLPFDFEERTVRDVLHLPPCVLE